MPVRSERAQKLGIVAEYQPGFREENKQNSQIRVKRLIFG